MVRSRTVRPEAGEAVWDRETFDSIIGIPCDPAGLWTGEVERPLGADPDIPRIPVDRPAPPADEPRTRRVMISREILSKFGFTEGCSKCRAIDRNDESQPGLAHNRDCRERIEKLMSNDPVLKKNLENAESRQNKYFARQIEKSEESVEKVETRVEEGEPGIQAGDTVEERGPTATGGRRFVRLTPAGNRNVDTLLRKHKERQEV